MGHLNTEDKKKIFAEFGGSAVNTGSTEAQIAMFSQRIDHISDHLRTNRKDRSSTRALLKLVGKRRKLLQYLAKKDIVGYRTLIGKLGLRR